MTLSLYPALVLMTAVSILLSPLLFLVVRVLTRRTVGQAVRLLIWIYGRAWLLLFSPFMRFRVENLTPRVCKLPCLFVANHLSFFDIYCMGALPDGDVVIVVGAWPFRLFWYAPFMRLGGYLDIERLSPEDALERCRRHVEAGAGILFFPEGSRSRDGALQRFHSGAFKMARELGLDVVPLCIAGTDDLLPPGRFWLAPAQVRMRALSRVDPRQFPGELGHIAMRKYIKRQMADNLARMQAEAS